MNTDGAEWLRSIIREAGKNYRLSEDDTSWSDTGRI